MYPISFYDRNDALRTGLTRDEEWSESGVWIEYQGERIFIEIDRIRNESMKRQ